MWHPEVITVATQETARSLEHTAVEGDFYLAGGTGLALQLGHRRSHDLDFFSSRAFSEENLIQDLRQTGEFTVAGKAPHTLHIAMRGVKVSFLAYNYPLLFPLGEFLGMKVADTRDIACMKLGAVAGRGTRRDFVDLYVAASRFGLARIFALFEQKFTGSRYNPVHLQKSLTYFQDAEKDPMPDMLISISWDAVKQFFSTEVPRLL